MPELRAHRAMKHRAPLKVSSARSSSFVSRAQAREALDPLQVKAVLLLLHGSDQLARSGAYLRW